MKDKKVKRYRGSKTHGCGSMKKRRGAGNRGGRGAAGSGKRGDCKKPSIWKNRYFGPLGFTSRTKKFDSVNLAYIESRAENWAAKNIIKSEGGFFIIDIKNLGYKKLLSKGNVTKKFKITCDQASPRAIEKIKKAGGEVVVTEVKNHVEKDTDEPAGSVATDTAQA